MFGSNYQPKANDTFKIFSCCGAPGHLTIRFDNETYVRLTVKSYDEKVNLIRVISIMAGLEVVSTHLVWNDPKVLRPISESETFIFREWTPENRTQWEKEGMAKEED